MKQKFRTKPWLVLVGSLMLLISLMLADTSNSLWLRVSILVYSGTLLTLSLNYSGKPVFRVLSALVALPLMGLVLFQLIRRLYGLFISEIAFESPVAYLIGFVTELPLYILVIGTIVSFVRDIRHPKFSETTL